ncbi:MAG: recombinase family protein [Clostridia bacterium]|nr:recombinase family protein [Clostridia bacterium]
MGKVTVIPATRDFHTGIAKNSMRKRRVAAYARVSTNSEEQVTSYEAQVDYYTKYIQGRADWEFVKVYTDEGISGTNTKHRDGFNEMIEDALAGQIDLIITKSVSRFARNTVDSLITVRKLKEKGIEVYFEKENIYTLDSKGELLITIMSSLAQEESRSISENITWGKRKFFADGKVYLPYKNFLGYEKGEDGLPKIVPDEADIIRLIYSMFLEGKTTYAIATALTENGIPTPRKKVVWKPSTVESILTNEKYKGAALLQKSFTVDFLTKKMKPNEGEVPQYYIEDSHEAIIDPREFELVQAEMARRKGLRATYSGNSIFASRIICGDCGSFYGAKTWHSTSKYRKIIYRCFNKYADKDHKCETPTLNESDIKDAFIAVFNILMADKEAVLDACRVMQETLTDTTEIDEKIARLQEAQEDACTLLQKHVDDNMRIAQDQEAFWKRYEEYEARVNELAAELDSLKVLRLKRIQKAEIIGAFMFELYERDGVIEAFDERLWIASVDTVTVYKTGEMVFRFKNEMEIKHTLSK